MAEGQEAAQIVQIKLILCYLIQQIASHPQQSSDSFFYVYGASIDVVTFLSKLLAISTVCISEMKVRFAIFKNTLSYRLCDI